MFWTKKKEEENYKDFDDLGLYMTLIESTQMTFSPQRTLEFRIVKPFDFTGKEITYCNGSLFFENIVACSLTLVNETREYPEFYRSAVLINSELLNETKLKHKKLKKPFSKKLKHYYLYLLEGDYETEVHIICESHKIILEDEPKPLHKFNGFEELYN
jgi:hypothetical protein